MDFYSLSRKELQALCKKNKIPANITNLAMADALSALPHVEGLDEILNPTEGDAGTPNILNRTACRTSTQRKTVKELESSKVSTRPCRGTRAGVAEGVVEQENKDANVSATPAMVPSSRRRVPAVSTRRKKEVVIIEDDGDGKNGDQEKPKDVPKTPAAAPSSRTRATGRSACNKNETPIGPSVQSQRAAYSTRRSVRLLGKSLSEMSLAETEDMGISKIDDVSEELSSVSQHVEDSTDTEKGASLQTVSTDELEVSSLNKDDYECRSRDLSSGVKLVSGTENDAEDELQAEPQEEGSGKVIHVEAESHDSSLNLQGSFGACDESNEAEPELLPEIEDSCDSAKLENKECDGTKQDALSVEVSEEASMEIADQATAPVEACDALNESGSKLLRVDESCDSAILLENKECFGTEEEASEESSMEIADQDIAPIVVPDDAALLCVSPVKDASVSLKELIECSIEGDEQAADRKDVSREKSEELSEPKPDNLEEPSAEIEKIEYTSHITGASSAILAEKNESSGNSGAENEVEKVIHQLLLLGVAAVHEAEDQKDTCDKVEAEAQAEELEAANAFSCVPDGTQMPVSDQQGSVESDFSEDIAIPKQEPYVSAETESVTAAQISDIALQSMVSEETKMISIEDGMGNANNMMKENLTIAADFHNMSLRGLQKLLKNITGKTNNNDVVPVPDGGKKRAALKDLSQNRWTTGEAQNDRKIIR